MRPDANARHDRALGNLQVLVIDDQDAALRIVKDMLFEMGVPPVLAVTDPRKALELLKSEHVLIDVVLCDWRMPHMSGLDLLRQVRGSKPELPFLMITGTADASSVLAAKESGATGYIRKPFSADELRHKLTPIARLKAHRA